MLFRDRRDAGCQLAAALRERVREPAIVLALPRGGVPVGYEVARALRLPLDVLVVRKLGVPGQQELALGAVARGGMLVFNPAVVRAFALRQEEIDGIVAREQQEIERREAQYRRDLPALALEGRRVILVDDGLATGATMLAAVRALRSTARHILVAVPVGASSACLDLEREADELVCLHAPAHFQAVGAFYEDFQQTPDEEVAALLALARGPAGDLPPRR